ncbi:hypothetical protein DVX59_13325 [Enterococcus faecalis]|nr:hypothetical protein DVX59_13325 [Enterococcus faecalis]
MWLKTLYRKRAVTWPFIFYTIIWTLSKKYYFIFKNNISYYLYPKDYYVIFLSVSAYKIIF